MNWFDLNGRTALIQAVAEGNLEVVRALVKIDYCELVADVQSGNMILLYYFLSVMFYFIIRHLCRHVK